MNDAGTNRTMPQKCPQCGASLPMGVLAGLCPACLMQQGAATADNLTRATVDLLRDAARRAKVKARLAEIIVSLGEPGAPRRAAKAIVSTLNKGT